MEQTTHEQRLLIAALCGIGEPYLYQVLTRRRVASEKLCVLIERATAGRIMRWHLRPDDWADIWPELKTWADAPELKAA